METIAIKEIQSVLPYLLKHKTVWSSYDEDTDVLYLHFRKPNQADDSMMTDDDIIIRYEKGEMIGLTILNASRRIQQEV